MFVDATAKHPNGDALIDDDARLSYRDVAARVGVLAGAFAARGVGSGDRVALLLANRIDFVCALLATTHLGAVTVPINVREQTPGLRHILRDCAAKLLVFEADLTKRLPTAEETPALRHRVCVGDLGETTESLASLYAEARNTPAPAAAKEEDVAVILYTSGTTGQPKGAMLTHFNIAHSVMHYEQCLQLSKHDRSIIAVPASHVTGIIAQALTMLHVAGCSIMLRAFTAEAFLSLAQAQRFTHTIMVPAMYNLCLLRTRLSDYDLKSWRIGGYGGAPMPEATISALARELPSLVLVNAYGATETTSPATVMPIGDTSRKPKSVGRAVACADLTIKRENGTTAAPGETGEIWIGGPMVVPGYWQDEERTAEAFAQGCWRSGDMGSLDDEGFLTLYDRKKDMIIRGGYNVYSIELENALSHHPNVDECAAVGQTDSVLGEKIHVFVRTKEASITAEALRAFCASRLAEYKVPDVITFIEEPLPRNANGKVLKHTLRERTAKSST